MKVKIKRLSIRGNDSPRFSFEEIKYNPGIYSIANDEYCKDIRLISIGHCQLVLYLGYQELTIAKEENWRYYTFYKEEEDLEITIVKKCS